MKLVEYILGDLWHFIGAIIILGVIFDGIIDVVKAFKK